MGENALGRIGAFSVERIRSVAHLAGMVSAVLWLAVQPKRWPQTVRDVLARQVLFTGVEAVRFMALIALLVGMSIVVQVQLLLTRVGQSELLGPILVAVVIRELGPLLTNFVVIGRSGAAITTELGNMKVNGEIRLLDAQGLDPFTYLVLPRVTGMMISVFCLTVVFVVVAFVSGYVSGLWMGANTGTPGLFALSVMGAVTPADVFSLLAKTLIPGLLTGAICCSEGLGVGQAVTEVPQATTRGLVRSVGALFVVSALISLLFYL
jgi:phospholipid/cholesterol/gamma-HCH transport system permease protein